MKISNYQKQFRALLVLVISFFAISLVYFSNIIIQEIKERELQTIDRYAKFIQIIANNDIESANYFIDDILIKNHSIPVIVTNSDGKIIEFKNISKTPEKIDEALLLKFYIYEEKYQPIVIDILDENDNKIDFQLIYYNNSKTLEIIIFAPYFIFILTVLILLTVYLIFYYSNKSERDSLWTGLAKETAHQLIVIFNWMERAIENNKKVDKRYVSEEIDKDLDKLKTITDRFSNIGSKPKLINQNLKNR